LLKLKKKTHAGITDAQKLLAAVWQNLYERGMIPSKKFQSEPMWSLICPVISRPHFASLRDPKWKAWPVRWG